MSLRARLTFSFGTNDLTQMTFGYSRDDAGSFIPKYMDLGILESDPTSTIDQDGVGKLMRICVELGRNENQIWILEFAENTAVIRLRLNSVMKSA